MGKPDDTNRAAGTPLATYETLREIARSEYPTLVADAIVERDPGDAPRNLRIFFVDDGFLDVWLSKGKYSYHWQSGADIVRFDNAPHHEHVATHPHHRHVKAAVTESPLDGDPESDFPSVIEYLQREWLP